MKILDIVENFILYKRNPKRLSPGKRAQPKKWIPMKQGDVDPSAKEKKPRPKTEANFDFGKKYSNATGMNKVGYSSGMRQKSTPSTMSSRYKSAKHVPISPDEVEVKEPKSKNVRLKSGPLLPVHGKKHGPGKYIRK